MLTPRLRYQNPTTPDIWFCKTWRPRFIFFLSYFAAPVFCYDVHERHPLLRRPRTKIFHPPTGLCVTRRSMADPLKLGPCTASDSWRYTPQEFLMVSGTYFCLRAVGLGAPVRLGIICDPSDSRWQLVSGSEKTHLATKLTDGTEVCLDVDSDGCLVSNSCDGFHGGDDERLQLDSQWFKLLTAGFKKQSQPS
ncbi:hypothetical protein BHE74_00024434 [Ensete ventricosum]|nr:hypothetical protein BHE74_00024434 [Ensete ventricosum]RZR80832.1 hypothetical protein BHM03_00006925 [Ensete ventricosum]